MVQLFWVVARRLVAVTVGSAIIATAAHTAYAADTAYAQHKPLALREPKRNADEVPAFSKFELILDLDADYDNPFDPEQIDVRAEFRSPDGRKFLLYGFLDQPHTRKMDGNREVWTPDGAPAWRVRFAPDVPGTWRYQIYATNKGKAVSLKENNFLATASKSPGLVRIAKRNPRGFEFDNGDPYFPVGENIGWGGSDRGAYDYDDWLPALGKAGGNWQRIWMSASNCGLEWIPWREGSWSRGNHQGMGIYALDNAAKLDYILDTAERSGVYTMVCLGTFGELTEGGYFNEGQWKFNPYNAANGGPCAKAEDFCTNETARKLYRRRLRYIGARYGWRPFIHSWEFWNEYNAPASWVAEMASYLKGTGAYKQVGADPYRHLITTTYGSPDVWKIADLDFTQSHHYGQGNVFDHAPIIHEDAEINAVYNKPHLMGEFGIDFRKPDTEYDPDGLGINFHNGIWSSAASGNAGSAMLWWWDNYIHPKKLYAPFGALRRFADTVKWNRGAWKPLKMNAPKQTEGTETFSDLTVVTDGSWGKAPKDRFRLTASGVEGGGSVFGTIFSPVKPELRTIPTFEIDAAKPCRFIVTVGTVSQTITAKLSLDGTEAKTFTLSAEPPKDPAIKPEYVSTEFKKEYNIYQAEFKKEIAIDIPAGKHTVTLEATEGDWMRLDAVTVTNYRSSRYAQVNLYGVASGREAVIWAQNALHNWKFVADKRTIASIENAVTTVRGLPDGAYKLVWWDTWKGAPMKEETVSSVNGELLLKFPALAKDVAAHLSEK